jgi:hypothetical protein
MGECVGENLYRQRQYSSKRIGPARLCNNDEPLGRMAMGDAFAELYPFRPAVSTGLTKSLSGEVEDARSYLVMGCSFARGEGVLSRVVSPELLLSAPSSRLLRSELCCLWSAFEPLPS